MAAYPQHLETTVELRDGTPVRLRPVRPTDEPRLQDLFAHMSREDVRLRFFIPMRELSHALGERLTHLDYDLQMALMAEHDGATLGIARYAADPDRRRAEFAVAVRSDWHGRGIGYLLMTRLIEIAGAAGIREVFGDVLRENEPMLTMCRELGFTLAANPGDGTLTRVRKSLA
jgi:acetyltransferase